ncbi:glycine dehydrogenase (aminomethyl-transferring) [Candidatus Micrarchaeota archaeon CG_4_10_14_0_2_um_filter_49_7]|nr:MAG: glycine dehydrogenase (aminomethyl-transferring) [Candidatus Micrarchaeota archaeon CG1_02_49_24]PIZ98252.1 MAG: glycine dehydrogenase (aminomethyl-transferring) [Candidatus Micrarchaeota archaeon CG_4_10_14_0_2_um_filter_49_7]HII53221.1 glycine dehydrogenase subunit 2 [Candidatus Micrarchaeota archaeon]
MARDACGTLGELKLIFEHEGTNTNYVPMDMALNDRLPSPFNRKNLPLPDVSEVDVVRHFTLLSQRNYSVDTVFYPLGSCTMKYNPKINESASRLEGFAAIHPLQPAETCQGALQLMYELERDLCEITGMDAVTLQPAAGAHGELTALMIARAHFHGKRKKIILPDSAHGTNPASAAICGFEVVNIPSNEKGCVDLPALEKAMDETVAVFMLTNPNTVGIMEENMPEIVRIVHGKGGLIYCDGANMNAMLGITRPGDQGFDLMHLNLHKTFSIPHGGGGPGSGPVCVKAHLEKYLPLPRVVKKGDEYSLDYSKPDSIGRVRSFHANFGVLVKAYAYIKALGPGLKKVAEAAVLNANYMLASLRGSYPVPHDRLCAHEFVLSGDARASEGVHTTDIAKRLLDYGYHAPTIYFPLIVHEALMIEPTETEGKETLDGFIAVMRKIAGEPAELVKGAPYTTPVGRLDGVAAARKPNLRWNREA